MASMVPMETWPRFFVLSGPEVGRDFTCPEGGTLGRARTCAVSLKGNALSRTHARLERDGDGWVLVDAGSRNGLQHANVRIERLVLENGTEVTLGDVSLRVRLEHREEGLGVNQPGAGTSVPGPTPPPAAAAPPPGAARAVPAPANTPQQRPATATPAPADADEIVLEGNWEAAADSPLSGPGPGAHPAPPAPSVPREPTTPTAAPLASAAPPTPAARAASAPPSPAAVARARAGLRPAAPDTGGRQILQYSQVTERRGFLGSDLAQHPAWVRLVVGLGVVAGATGVCYLVFAAVKALRGAP